VIYTRPGFEVELDSIVQDAIRLNSAVNVYLAELQIMILQVEFQNFDFWESIPIIFYSFAGHVLGVVREI
jgi:positive regulator of sigma E activity